MATKAKNSDTGEVEVSRISFNEMPAAESEKAIELIKEVWLRAKKGELRTFSEIARAIKASLDTKMGPTVWHVIVGEQFGSFVSHETSKIIYLFLQKVGVLCWSHG